MGDSPSPAFELLTPEAIQLILDHEIAGGQKQYEAQYMHPVWPKAASGVTIGVGYDLGYTSPSTFKSDWGGRISAAALTALSVCLGKKGQRAKALLAQVRDVTVPWTAAKAVFLTRTVPDYYAKTAKVFPGLEKLPKNAQGALVSLVFNRGDSLEGQRRTEMRAIRELVPKRDLAGIAGELRKMKRLWIGKGVKGLLRRRDDEAALVERCITEGQTSEVGAPITATPGVDLIQGLNLDPWGARNGL